eukprot:6490401-Amphidinium_carterae.2
MSMPCAFLTTLAEHSPRRRGGHSPVDSGKRQMGDLHDRHKSGAYQGQGTAHMRYVSRWIASRLLASRVDCVVDSIVLGT